MGVFAFTAFTIFTTQNPPPLGEIYTRQLTFTQKVMQGDARAANGTDARPTPA